MIVVRLIEYCLIESRSWIKYEFPAHSYSEYLTFIDTSNKKLQKNILLEILLFYICQLIPFVTEKRHLHDDGKITRTGIGILLPFLLVVAGRTVEDEEIGKSASTSTSPSISIWNIDIWIFSYCLSLSLLLTSFFFLFVN